jgi:hypothetical protein
MECSKGDNMNYYLYTGILITLQLIITFVIILLKGFFEEKGKLFANIQHKKELTEIEEEVKSEFNQKSILFTNKSSYFINRYLLLYSELYAIVAQSEYLRYFYNTYTDTDFSSNEQLPFIENNSNRTVTKFKDGKMSMETIPTNVDISSFNKEHLYKLIIEKPSYASQELLSLALAYRFVHRNYLIKDISDHKIKEGMLKEEVNIIYKMVQLIVYEYNWLRKQIGLGHSKKEYETNFFDTGTFNIDSSVEQEEITHE